MELLDQSTYTGPPPRYSAGQAVTYQGQPYTVARVLGRAPLVGWAYELDGPGELVQVGEGEIRPDIAHPPPRNTCPNIAGPPPGTMLAQATYGLWSDPYFAAAAQQAAEDERKLLTICEVAGQPPGVVRMALATWIYGLDALLDALRAGTAIITTDGYVVRRWGTFTRDWGAGMATRASVFTKIIIP